MFVDLMGDLRKTLASYFFRAQFGTPRPQQQVPAQRLKLTGPSDTPGGTLAEQAAQAGQQRRPPAQQQRKQEVDELGMSARAASGAVLPQGGPDPSQLATNRGQEEKKQTPVTVEDEPGRNDPCPCGSGKKYKKCHGRV